MNSTDKAADRQLEIKAARIGALVLCAKLIKPIATLHSEFSPEAGGVLLADIVSALTELFTKVDPHFIGALDEVTVRRMKEAAKKVGVSPQEMLDDIHNRATERVNGVDAGIKAQMNEAIKRETTAPKVKETVEVNGVEITDPDKITSLKELFDSIDKLIQPEAAAPKPAAKGAFTADMLRETFDRIVSGDENSAN